MSDSALLQRTPLFAEHLQAGARMTGFGGWEMPVFYTSILDEHLAVRTAAGVFDISHMGQIVVTGSGAEDFLNHLLTNNVAKLAPGQGQYTLMLNERGGVIDDLIAYRQGAEEFFLVVNASMIAEDFAWMQEQVGEGVTLTNRSEEYAGLAAQGPLAVGLLETLLGQPLPPRNGLLEIPWQGTPVLVARTGYTGEDGAELFVPAAAGAELWKALLAAGFKPCGLGSRDTLRLEMCYPLNGSDLSPERTPLEAGLGFFVDLAKPDFIGKDLLEDQKIDGLALKLAPFRMMEKSPPPRSHYPVLAAGEVIGETCSGGLSPSLGIGIGMAYLPPDQAKPGTEIEIDIRGKKFRAQVEKKPLYKKP